MGDKVKTGATEATTVTLRRVLCDDECDRWQVSDDGGDFVDREFEFGDQREADAEIDTRIAHYQAQGARCRRVRS